MPEGGNQIADEVVGQRPGRLHTLLFEWRWRRPRTARSRWADSDRRWIPAAAGPADSEVVRRGSRRHELHPSVLPLRRLRRTDSNSSPHRFSTSRTADLINDVCSDRQWPPRVREVVGAIPRADLVGLDQRSGDLGDQIRLPVGADRKARRCRGSTP
jgi:hypothetical protein